MSIFEYLCELANSNSVVGFWRNYITIPAVNADITKESVECMNEDGSTGKTEVCKDEETGERVKCPCCGEEGHTINVRGVGIFARARNFFRSLADATNDMAPPYYSDLGKKANDVFAKGYHFGVFKLDLKTKSDTGVEFSSGIVSNHESGKVFGSLASKYVVKDYGLTFTERWNTENVLATDITIADKIAEGLKLTLEGTFAPQTGSKSGRLKTSYLHDRVALNTNMELDLAGPIMDVAAVLGHQGWLAGTHAQFDSQKNKFTKNNFALGYQNKDFALHTNVDNGKDFGGSIYQKVSERLECGVSMKWTTGSSDTLFGVGAKLLLEGADASLHAKVNNKSLIGLGYTQQLRKGVILTLSACIDGQNFNAGGHKVGVALELEP